ncbi:unnamed protein product [Alopecurus aequalis]
MEHHGHGAGEKKGVVESITEKLPGGHADQHQTIGEVTGIEAHGTGEKLPGGHADPQHTTGITGSETHATTATSDGNYGQPGTDGTGEKKSIMDKIKDKLPGQH